MRPAFSTLLQAGSFAALLLAALLMPVIFGRHLLPNREEIYATAPMNLGGCYPYIDQQIFKEKGDIDIAFIGNSHIWAGIDTPYVQAELSRQLGRKATVVTFGWNWPGFDALYFISRDLIANRKVRMLVINEEYNPDWPIPHVAARQLFRYGEDFNELSGLPVSCKAAYYADALRGLPRNILAMVRTNLPSTLLLPENTEDKSDVSENFAEHLGSLSAKFGYGTETVNNTNFVEFRPAHDVPISDVCILSPETRSRFQFTGPPTPAEHLYFAKKLAALAQSKDIKLVVIHFPKVSEQRLPAVPERECWPEILPGNVTLMGIPPAALLAGVDDQDIRKLFYNNSHLNKNGQEYFTRSVTPALLKLYAQ